MKKRNALIKKYFSNDERFADLWNGYYGRPLLDADKLITLEPHGLRKSGRKETVKELEHDLLKQSCGAGTYGIYGIENQETVDYRMVIRSMSYMLDAYERQVEELQAEHTKKGDLGSEEYLSGISKEDRVDPSAVLVVYYGNKPWDGVVDLHSLLKIKEDSEEYGRLFPNYQMNLLDVQRFQHTERFQTDIRLFFGFLQRKDNRDDLWTFIKENEKQFQCMPEDAYDVIASYGGSTVVKKMKEQCKTEGGYDMCKAFDEMRKEERLKGKKEGKREGKKEGEKCGEEKMAGLIKALLKDNLMEDVEKVLRNKSYRGKMYKKYGIS